MAVLGLDISKYQLYDSSPPGSFDWQAAYDAGARFVFMRTTRANVDGSVYTDIRLDDYAQSRQFLLLAGFYAYVRLEFDPIRQADVFLEAIQNYLPARAVIDLEGQRPGTLTPTQAAVRLRSWLDHVEAATGQTPMIYTRQSWFDSYIAASDEWQQYPLWLARYPGYGTDDRPSIDGPFSDGLFEPRDWTNWTFWQFTDNGPGLRFGAQSLEIDLDLFNGSEAELVNFIGDQDDPGTPPPPSQGAGFQVEVDLLNVRSGPSLSYAIVDRLQRGDRVAPKDIDGYHAWIEINPGKWACVSLNGRRFMRPIDL